MLQPKSKAKVLMFDKSHEDNLPTESTAAEMDVSNSVIVDAIENDTLCQREYEVQTVVEAGNETSPTLVGCNKVDKNKTDAAKEEHLYDEHAAEEAERGLQEAKEGEEPDDDNGGGGGGGGEEEEEEEEEEPNEYDDDNEDDIDVDHDEGLEEYDDNNVDDDEDPDEYDDDNIHDYEDSDSEDFDEDDDYDDEKDDVMEDEEIDETEQLENNDNTVEENDDIQRNTVKDGKKQENFLEENEEREGGCLKEKVKILTKGSERKNEINIVEEGKKQENAKEENEEREGGSLKKKVKISRKGSERKKDTTEVSDRVASKRKDKQLGDVMEEAEQENGKKDIQDKEVSHKYKFKKLSKSTSSKVATGGSKKVASKRDNKVESSQRKKSSKKVKSMGMIFMCSSKTKRDCYHYKVLGLPANKRDIVGKIYKGMRLFLYDFDLKLMYGIYKAAGPGGYNIQPRAFNSHFPSQVRFTVLEDCIPLAEEKFKKVIKDNYYTKTKFDCQLTSLQVKNLCKLFVSASKRAKSEVLAKRLKTCASTDQNRSRAWERQSAMDEKRRNRKYSTKRKREVITSPVAPVPLGTRLLVPPAAAIPSFPYDRTLEMDAYEQDLLVKHCDSHRRPIPVPERRRDAYRTAQFLEHRDVYRRDPLLDRLDSYREDKAVEQRDLRSRDEIGMYDPYISYGERPEHRDLKSRDDFRWCDPRFTYRSPEKLGLRSEDEIRRRDPYMSYRERIAYWDHVYGTGSLPEHDHYHPISRSTEYRSAVAPLPAYRSARPLYRY